MKRFAFATMVGALLLLLTGVPASAQYEQPPTEEPVQPRTVANVSDPDVSPGDAVTVTVPPVFASGTQVSINLARAQQDQDGVVLDTATTGSDGSVSQSVTIPATQDGVYFLYVTGVDADGFPVVAIVAIVIRDGVAAASAVEEENFSAAAAPAPAPLPLEVVQAQSNLTPDTEAAVVEAVTQGAAGLALSPEGTLSVRTPAGVQEASTLPTTGGDGIATQVLVGAALLLSGAGLVMLRRRGGFAK